MSFKTHIALCVGCIGFVITALCLCGATVVMSVGGIDTMSGVDMISISMDSIATSEIVTFLTGLVDIDLNRIIGAPCPAT